MRRKAGAAAARVQRPPRRGGVSHLAGNVVRGTGIASAGAPAVEAGELGLDEPQHRIAEKPGGFAIADRGVRWS